MRLGIRYLVVLLPISMAFHLTAFSWEADVHFGITYWLARQVGFSAEDAFTIASANQGLDDGYYSPAPQAVTMAILLGDVNASKEVQENHFPGDGPVPGKPEERSVYPGWLPYGSPVLLDRLHHLLATSQKALPLDHRLKMLGRFLHALQDSFSHQGVPDIPFGLRPQLSWGHPEDRGGWTSHSADITTEHPSDADYAVHETYHALRMFMQQNMKLYKPSSVCSAGQHWSGLEQRVSELISAKTKEEKRKWFSTDSCFDRADLTFLLGISQPGSVSDIIKYWRAHWGRKLEREARVASEAPGKLRQTVERLLDLWVRRRDSSGLLEYFSIPDINSQLGEEWGEEEPNPESWLKKTTTMWLAWDHGAVEALGHGSPAHPGFGELPQAAEGSSLAMASFDTLSQAISSPTRPEEPYQILPLEEGGRWLVAFRFRHAPRDTVWLVLAQSQEEEQWKAVGFGWNTF